MKLDHADSGWVHHLPRALELGFDKSIGATSLADHDGMWCVFCLEPIRDVPLSVEIDYPFSLELHHPFPQSTFRSEIKPFFSATFPCGWTVPAHANCHSEHYPDAFAVAQYVLSALRIEKRAFRDSWARACHDAGLYWHSLAMNAGTLRKHSNDLEPEETATLMERQLSSASGIRSRVHPFREEAIHAMIPAEQRSRVLYHLVNRQANRGHGRAAQATYERAQSFRGAARGEGAERLELSARLRHAQIERTTRAGQKAVVEAIASVGASAYSYLTAILLLGWNMLSEEKPGARVYFDEVLANASWASWLYVAEALFGKSCQVSLWESHSSERLYQWLVQAQYIYIMLGLQVTPHTLLPVRLGVPRDESCFPGHLLVSGRFSGLSAERRLILRREAIGVEGDSTWLYKALQDVLCGRTGCRDRIALLQT